MDLGGAAAVFSLWLCLLAAVPEVAVICVLPVVLVSPKGGFEPAHGLSSYDPGEVISSLSFKFLSRSDGNLQSVCLPSKTAQPDKRAIE